jgi:hypothetical protein
MSKSRKFSAGERATVAFMIATCCTHPAFAGTEGSFMNGAGIGVAVDSITSVSTYGTYKVSKSSPNGASPCAAVNRQSSFSCTNNASLPPFTSRSVYCQSVGYPNYQWVVSAYVTGGATADNPDLDFLNLVPQQCAEISLQTQFLQSKSVIQVTGHATDGAAAVLTGYKVPEGVIPENDADLKTQGDQVFQVVLKGPFDSKNCSVVDIPVEIEDPETFFFQVDTVALSTPIELACPPDVVFQCGDPAVYPNVTIINPGCIDPDDLDSFTVSYAPAEDQLPIGQPTQVTATVYDADQIERASCTFMATRYALEFAGFFSPIGAIDGSCSQPKYTAKLGSVIPIKFISRCGATDDSGVTPVFEVRKCNGGEVVSVGEVKLVANEWHGNWDTSTLPNTNASKGVYDLIVTLQDGSTRSVFLRIN